MADRTSAAVFGQIYAMLAEDPSDDHRALALRIWDLGGEFDFSPYQMYVDGALAKLGLYRRVPDSECPEEAIDEYGPEKSK